MWGTPRNNWRPSISCFLPRPKPIACFGVRPGASSGRWVPLRASPVQHLPPEEPCSPGSPVCAVTPSLRSPASGWPAFGYEACLSPCRCHFETTISAHQIFFSGLQHVLLWMSNNLFFKSLRIWVPHCCFCRDFPLVFFS